MSKPISSRLEIYLGREVFDNADVNNEDYNLTNIIRDSHLQQNLKSDPERKTDSAVRASTSVVVETMGNCISTESTPTITKFKSLYLESEPGTQNVYSNHSLDIYFDSSSSSKRNKISCKHVLDSLQSVKTCREYNQDKFSELKNIDVRKKGYNTPIFKPSVQYHQEFEDHRSHSFHRGHNKFDILNIEDTEISMATTDCQYTPRIQRNRSLVDENFSRTTLSQNNRIIPSLTVLDVLILQRTAVNKFDAS